MIGDLEHFGGGSEGGGEMSEAAMEAFREQMRSTAQQLKAQQKGEQKRKKKEDKLAKLLTQFLQKKSGRSDLAFLAAHVLALNIPPAFVLSILLLGDRQSQHELTMTAKEDDKGLEIEVSSSEVIESMAFSQEDLDLIRTEDAEKSDLIKEEIVIWGEIMYIQAKNDALRIMKNAYDEEEKIREEIPNYLGAVLRHFMNDNNANVPPENLESFAEIMLGKICTSLKKDLEKLQNIRTKEFELPEGTSGNPQ